MKDRTRFERALAVSGTLAAAGLALFALLTLLGGGSGAVHAAPTAELHVCSTCTYTTIQEAVDAANPGDVIMVAQGTYTHVHHIASLDTATFTATQIVAITKSLTLRGGYNADFSAWDPQAYRTLLDAGGRGRGILIAGAGITPTLEGLHVTGGDATGLGGEWWQDSGLGGGVYVQDARPVISGNVVYANAAPDYGGGMLIRNSDATIAGNHIYGNTSNARGGGLYLDDGSDVTLRDNAIYSNVTAVQGGGIGVYWSNPTIEGNLIYSNTSAYAGGGVYLLGAGAGLSANILTGNVAYQGGGLWAKDCPTIDLVNNVLAQNRADVAGSGLYVDNDPWYDTAGRLRHNTIVSNTGVGQGVFVGVNTTLSFTNTIIVSHTVGVTVTGGSTVTLDTTLWHANGSDWGGNVATHNDYHHDPGLAADGYHLVTGSFAIDRGVDAGVTTDVDGDARPQGAGFDIGGGLYIHAARPVITGNVVFSNTADLGGGLYLNTSAATITGNAVTSNTTQDSGGGLYLYWSNGATLHKNTIAANLSDFGGGVFLHHSGATLGENTISNNLARKDSGRVAVGSSSATLRANVISGNQANHSAGGLSLYSCYGARLEGNEIAANTAGHNAGGMWLDASDVTLVNNAVVKNQASAAGSGVYVQAATVRMVHTTVAQNSGGDGSGLHVVGSYPNYSTVALTNTIIAGHRVGITVTAGNTATLNATLWHGNTLTDTGGAGSVTTANDYSGDPVFAADGYHLGSTSAAIDRGLNAGVTTDIDGQSRPQDSGYDLGADEFTCVGLTGVSIAGPTTGTVGVVYAFTATVAPPSASPPITYTWDPAPAPGSLLLPGGSATIYVWDAAGDYTITLTATNCGGSDTATHTIHVESRAQYIYLPLVLRNS